MDSTVVSALPNILLVGNDSDSIIDLCCSLSNAGVNATFKGIDELESKMLNRYPIILIDIDGNHGLDIARRIARNPSVVVATLSESDRPADDIIHIIKPIGWIDLQILLIRAGVGGLCN